LENKDDYIPLNNEIRALEEKYNIENDIWNLAYSGPFTLWQERAGGAAYIGTEQREQVIRAYNRQQIFIVLILLLIPALNLSGFSFSRVKKRMAEIGIRKAFGAKRTTILIQLLCENLITSLIGGLIGLGLSCVVLLNFRYWLLGVPTGETLPLNVMVSPYTWLAVFLACFVMNLLSAGLPAWRVARMMIIHSIHQNNNTL
jgi:putative ABC transport system permease protein